MTASPSDKVQSIQDKLKALSGEAGREVALAKDLEALEQIRIRLLGKKGALSEILRGLGDLAAGERPLVGAHANECKAAIESAISERKQKLEAESLAQQIQGERIDPTLPARRPTLGGKHPLTLVEERVIDVLSRIGFEVTTGPEVETEYLNFDAINIPKDHPARDMQDSFFLAPGVVLRTHTSPVQMRSMREKKWPLRILCPGAVYRCDSDATHSPLFHQIEGLWVDRGVRMSDLKGVLEYFAKEVFGSQSKIRLRPSYFPFVEPGAEVDVSCFLCKQSGKSCHLCKATGWIEILGAGMVHPHLFKEAGYDAKDVTGFAFGMGLERIGILLYEIPDIRMYFQNDVRFLSHFR